ncbi:hypothetical protein LSUE1_G002800, partial [Lachnellula suecica]
ETGMALLNFNPLYTLTLPILVLFSLPIAIFACITTIIAFNILLFRVLLIYIDLAGAVLPYYLLGVSPRPYIPQKTPVSPTAVPVRRRKRSNSSTGTITSIASHTSLSNSHSVLRLSQSVGPTRDFEGVGGWRLDNPNSEEEDALWTKINGRLELPAEHGRRHKRSLTGGAEIGRGREMEFGMVMNMGRARTPSKDEAYFGQPGQTSPKAGRRTPSLGA